MTEEKFDKLEIGDVVVLHDNLCNVYGEFIESLGIKVELKTELEDGYGDFLKESQGTQNSIDSLYVSKKGPAANITGHTWYIYPSYIKKIITEESNPEYFL